MSSLLENLMTRAAIDPREESAFFRALMKATVYAHIPLTDRIDVDSDRIRFVQFHRPDTGQLVLPFFTDEAKARFAAQSAAKIIAMEGRIFLELTRGATLMLDPNDVCCVLYPEEVDGLLRTGRIATIQNFIVEEMKEPCVGSPHDSPAWLIDAVIAALSKLSFVQVAYLAGVYSNSDIPEQTGLLIALGGEPQHAERCVHAVATSLQPLCEVNHSLPVDMTHFDVGSLVPDWITKLELKPFYDRSWGKQLHRGAGSV